MVDRLAHLLLLLENNPGDPFLNHVLGLEYLKIGEAQTALLYFLKVLENDENYLGTYYHLAKLYEQLGRNKDAIETYKKGIQMANKRGEQKTLSELQQAFDLLSNP